MSSKNKKTLGQFFTTNYYYILQNLHIPEDIECIIEPFCGNGDLLNFQNVKEKYHIECYDIDPKKQFIDSGKDFTESFPIIQQDTLKNPPNYENKFVLTNPPYLARNKAENKHLFDKYDVNDLYKCFIKNIIENQCLGGIISIRKSDSSLREEFLKVYQIVYMNIFEEQVFDDTSYTVCSFQFQKRSEVVERNFIHYIPISIYPSGTKIEVSLSYENDYIIGGEIYNLPKKGLYEVSRATSKNKSKLNTNLLIKCIDDNLNSKINLSTVEKKDLYIDETPNLTSRTYASLIITPEISAERQEQLVFQFNTFLEQLREKYHSLFLTNYRESKDMARKRISFDLVYDIIIYILENT
jgi:hypothetical protein